MKKSWGVTGGVLLAVVIGAAVVGVGYYTASALAGRQDRSWARPALQPQQLYARGGRMAGAGLMHEVMEQALADGLGISEDELEDRLQAGETLLEVAEAEGADFEALITQAREQAWAEAVAQGLLTQEQADWMRDRMPTLVGDECPMWHERGLDGFGLGCWMVPELVAPRANPAPW
jgi:hypothetical protein